MDDDIIKTVIDQTNRINKLEDAVEYILDRHKTLNENIRELQRLVKLLLDNAEK